MPNNFKSSKDTDVFRVNSEGVVPLLRYEEGNLFEPIVPGSKEDPFRFQPQTFMDVIYGLQKVELALKDGSPEVAAKMLQRCHFALRNLLGAELERVLNVFCGS